MFLSNHITEELLHTYFAGRATPLQKQGIEQWLREPANAEFFYACLHTWEKNNLQYPAAVTPAIDRFHARLLNKPAALANTAEVKKAKRSFVKRVIWPRWVAAACLLFLLGLSAWLYRQDIFTRTYQTNYGQRQTILLADGSKVMLNANSCLQVPRFGFGHPHREVYLQGEASFSIVHTSDNKRFVVQTDSSFRVEVLGTEFNVFARARQTKVVLLQGKVKVHYGSTQQQPLLLVAGQLLTLGKKKATPQVKQVAQPENYTAWQQHRFVFENTSMAEIKSILQENYGFTVELMGDSIANKTLSGSFRAETDDAFLQGIAAVLDLNVNRQDNHVILMSND